MGARSTTQPTSSAVMRLLRSIVSGAPETSSAQGPNTVLRFLESQRAQEEKTPGAATNPGAHLDPAREAAMNHVRRLRIHAA